jgi:hypothetical protein
VRSNTKTKDAILPRLCAQSQQFISYDQCACSDIPSFLCVGTVSSIETLIDVSKETVLEVNAEKINCRLLSRHQNAGQNPDIMWYTSNTVPTNLGTTVTNQNFIQEETEKKQLSGRASYCSASCLLLTKRKNRNIQNYNFACGSVWM